MSNQKYNIRTQTYAITPLSTNREMILFPMLNFSDKLLLTGSSLLNTLDLLKRSPNDLDFSLKSPLTIDELRNIVDFFKLIPVEHAYGNTIRPGFDKSLEEVLKEEIMSFMVPWPINISEEDMPTPYMFKIDIFNKIYIEDKNIIDVIYPFTGKDIELQAVHPSIPIAHKAQYAFDPRVGAYVKHSNDLKDLLLNGAYYFKKIVTSLSFSKSREEDSIDGNLPSF